MSICYIILVLFYQNPRLIMALCCKINMEIALPFDEIILFKQVFPLKLNFCLLCIYIPLFAKPIILHILNLV